MGPICLFMAAFPSERCIEKDIVPMYIREGFMLSSRSFFSVLSHIYVFNPFWAYFCEWY